MELPVTLSDIDVSSPVSTPKQRRTPFFVDISLHNSVRLQSPKKLQIKEFELRQYNTLQYQPKSTALSKVDPSHIQDY
jgi:hypothetical protein